MYCIQLSLNSQSFLEKKGITEEDVHVMVSSNGWGDYQLQLYIAIIDNHDVFCYWDLGHPLSFWV